MARIAIALVVVIGCAADAPDAARPQGWMAAIDDGVALSELSIPGTHETMALYEPIAGVAKCQDLALDALLEAGVRYLDIRCRHLGDRFDLYHGPIFQQATFDDALATIGAFLDEHPTETVLVSVKEESEPAGNSRAFADTFGAYVAADPARWHLGAAVPALGEARGKIVLLRRFTAATAPLGIDASAWPDNATFSIADRGARLRVQDAYKVAATEDKWAAIAAMVAESRAATGTLFLNYTSGYRSRGPLPDTPAVATAINPQVDALLADPATAGAHLGVIVGDFMTERRAAAIIATNAR